MGPTPDQEVQCEIKPLKRTERESVFWEKTQFLSE